MISGRLLVPEPCKVGRRMVPLRAHPVPHTGTSHAPLWWESGCAGRPPLTPHVLRQGWWGFPLKPMSSMKSRPSIPPHTRSPLEALWWPPVRSGGIALWWLMHPDRCRALWWLWPGGRRKRNEAVHRRGVTPQPPPPRGVTPPLNTSLLLPRGNPSKGIPASLRRQRRRRERTLPLPLKSMNSLKSMQGTRRPAGDASPVHGPRG